MGLGASDGHAPSLLSCLALQMPQRASLNFEPWHSHWCTASQSLQCTKDCAGDLDRALSGRSCRKCMRSSIDYCVGWMQAVLAETGVCPLTKQPMRWEALTVLTHSNIERYRGLIRST